MAYFDHQARSDGLKGPSWHASSTYKPLMKLSLQSSSYPTTWTASVGTGALILGAAGILKGSPATTHWSKMGVLRIMGAKTQPEERIVHSGKIVTAAGVSAGIDLALWLAGEITGRQRAEAIQLTIEYDPHPPYDAGHISKASKATQKLAKEIMDYRMPADQRRLVPKIAWRRFIDLIRTGK
jgi:transcriptional regulator GlxA family with amidase domain